MFISEYLDGFDTPGAFDELYSSHNDPVNAISEEVIFNSLKKFNETLQHQARFLRNCMHVYEILLLFIRATRQGIWKLHLTSLELMTPSFFTYDLQNYAHLMPEYLAQIGGKVSWKG